MHLAKNGYTLLELILVVSLMTVLVTFIIPEFIDFNQRQQLKDAAVLVTDGLRTTQSLAAGGVQSDSDFTANYNFELFNQSGDPATFFRGFYIKRIDDVGTEINPILQTENISCRMCLSSANSPLSFAVPTGNVSGFSGSTTTIQACYPGEGQYTITVHQSGRVDQSDFSASSCTCPFSC